MASSSSGDPIDSHEANWVVANSWKRALRSREQRDAAHIILSAKPGTDPEAFLDAARATLRREFLGHAFVFALHTDRKHLHVHAVVQMTNAHGERIDPKIPDLRRWRETMAEEARRHHIPMEATSRFEKANPPAYKLRDVRMMERGGAPESVRRRVEAVQTNAIHVPKRIEGRAHAAKAAAGWRSYSAAESPRKISRATAPQFAPIYKQASPARAVRFEANPSIVWATRRPPLSFVNAPLPRWRWRTKVCWKSPGARALRGLTHKLQHHPWRTACAAVALRAETTYLLLTMLRKASLCPMSR